MGNEITNLAKSAIYRCEIGMLVKVCLFGRKESVEGVIVRDGYRFDCENPTPVTIIRIGHGETAAYILREECATCEFVGFSKEV